jgi:hypothetical protein
MKYILSLIVAVAFAAFTSSAFADDTTTTIWLTKSGDDSAKVCTEKSCLGTVKVKYADDATWATAKDSYEVSSATADAISKGACITVHGDGGISVSKPKMEATKAPAPAAKK